MEFFDEVVSKAQKAGKFIVKKADNAVDYVSLEYKLSSIRGKLDDQYRELGRLYFRLSETHAQDRGEMQVLLDAIKETQAELASCSDDIGKYKNICPSCKNANQAKADFCSKCGTKLK